jgi:hypothetical protein
MDRRGFICASLPFTQDGKYSPTKGGVSGKDDMSLLWLCTKIEVVEQEPNMGCTPRASVLYLCHYLDFYYLESALCRHWRLVEWTSDHSRETINGWPDHVNEDIFRHIHDHLTCKFVIFSNQRVSLDYGSVQKSYFHASRIHVLGRPYRLIQRGKEEESWFHWRITDQVRMIIRNTRLDVYWILPERRV